MTSMYCVARTFGMQLRNLVVLAYLHMKHWLKSDLHQIKICIIISYYTASSEVISGCQVSENLSMLCNRVEATSPSLL